MSPETLLTRLQTLGVDVQYLREALRLFVELLMELEISATIEAVHYERKRARKAYRNGYRERKWRTDLGEISLRIPRLRKGTYHPSFIESLSWAEPLLLALVQDAYVQGASMRSVQEMLRRLGLPPVHQSQIADVCEQLDDLVYRFRQCPLKAAFPYLWLDVLNLDLDGSQPVSIVLAVGIHDTNQREILSFEMTQHPDGEEFWRAFLRGLIRRRLVGVEVVLSGNYAGIQQAVRDVLGDVYWQPLQSLEKVDSVPLPLVSAISTLLLDAQHATSSPSPRSSLMELFGTDFLSAYTLVTVKQALSRPADAIGIALDEAAQLDGLESATIDAMGQQVMPLYQLYQPLAA
jgi:transposase-like protein